MPYVITFIPLLRTWSYISYITGQHNCHLPGYPSPPPPLDHPHAQPEAPTSLCNSPPCRHARLPRKSQGGEPAERRMQRDSDP